MQIEVFEPDTPLQEGRDELWVRVLSNQVVDWPTIYDALRERKEQFARVRTRGERLDSGQVVQVPIPLQYFPHLVSKDELEEHGYPMEDWFVFEQQPVVP